MNCKIDFLTAKKNFSIQSLSEHFAVRSQLSQLAKCTVNHLIVHAKQAGRDMIHIGTLWTQMLSVQTVAGRK